MSENKGDKARFQRERKKRNLRREKVREIRKVLESAGKEDSAPEEAVGEEPSTAGMG